MASSVDNYLNTHLSPTPPAFNPNAPIYPDPHSMPSAPPSYQNDPEPLYKRLDALSCEILGIHKANSTIPTAEPVKEALFTSTHTFTSMPALTGRSAPLVDLSNRNYQIGSNTTHHAAPTSQRLSKEERAEQKRKAQERNLMIAGVLSVVGFLGSSYVLGTDLAEISTLQKQKKEADELKFQFVQNRIAVENLLDKNISFIEDKLFDKQVKLACMAGLVSSFALGCIGGFAKQRAIFYTGLGIGVASGAMMLLQAGFNAKRPDQTSLLKRTYDDFKQRQLQAQSGYGQAYGQAGVYY